MVWTGRLRFFSHGTHCVLATWIDFETCKLSTYNFISLIACLPALSLSYFILYCYYFYCLAFFICPYFLLPLFTPLICWFAFLLSLFECFLFVLNTWTKVYIVCLYFYYILLYSYYILLFFYCFIFSAMDTQNQQNVTLFETPCDGDAPPHVTIRPGGSLESYRGKRKFTHDGFIYIRNKASKKDPSLIFWRCENKNECKVRISLK